MTDDIVERLRNSDGFKLFRAGDGHPALAADTDLMRRAAAEIERLRVANEDLDMVASLRGQEVERLRAQAADDIIWMSGIGTIPDEALETWRRISERWLTK